MCIKNLRIYNFVPGPLSVLSKSIALIFACNLNFYNFFDSKISYLFIRAAQTNDVKIQPNGRLISVQKLSSRIKIKLETFSTDQIKIFIDQKTYYGSE